MEGEGGTGEVGCGLGGRMDHIQQRVLNILIDLELIFVTFCNVSNSK